MFLTQEIVGATESTKAQKNSVEKKHRWSVQLEQSKLGKRHKMKRGTRCRGHTGQSCGQEPGLHPMSKWHLLRDIT